jgi:hypothetical protein
MFIVGNGTIGGYHRGDEGPQNGTIGAMKDHRIRLTDADIALIVSALHSRSAMTTGLRQHRLQRLAARLSEGVRGNPKLLLGVFGQTHEDEPDVPTAAGS